jgi:SpoVK/Ycf46/Vps4 family AAA+-type ATPase
MTHGYTGADLSALGRETAMKALRRYLPQINLEEERIPPDVLEKMEVQMSDFDNAYKEITPTAMREVYIEIPTVHWDDVGGLENVKQHLIEAVEWPLKTPEIFTPTVVFLDEIDSITPRRGMGMSDSGVSERVISQLLTEMDGIVTLQDIVVIAATNRPDMVDSAVLRPGRFDRLIYVPEPDEKSRLQILKIYTKGMPINKDVDLNQLTIMTKYYGGADIESLCREAAMHALRRDVNSTEVTMKDFLDALKEMGPSISPEMEKWYKSFMQQIRQVQKPQTPVA